MFLWGHGKILRLASIDDLGYLSDQYYLAYFINPGWVNGFVAWSICDYGSLAKIINPMFARKFDAFWLPERSSRQQQPKLCSELKPESLQTLKRS